MQQRKSGIILSYLNLAISIIIGLFYTPFLLRMLGSSEYGLYSLATALISYLSLLDLGFGNALVRYNAKIRAEGEKDASLNGLFLIIYSCVAVICFIIGIFLCDNISNFFNSSFTDEELYKARIIFIILFANVCISFPISVFTSLIKAYEKFTFSKIITILNTVISKGVTVIILYSGFRTSIAVAAVTAAVSILLGLASVIYCFVNIHVEISFKEMDKTLLKEITLYSFWIFINILVDQLYASTDSVILAKVSGTAAVTVYTIGVTFNGYFTEMSTAISGVFLPHISQIIASGKDMSLISEIFNRVSRLQYLFLSFTIFGFIIFGQEFIFLWAGPECYDSYYIALIIMIPALIPLSQNLGITVLQAMNRHKYRSIIYLFIAILNVVLSIPLAIKYEGIGSAIGTAIANLIGQICVMNWYYSKKIGLDIPTYWKEISTITLKMLPLALPGVLMNYLWTNNTWIDLIIKIIIFSMIYIIYGWLIIFNDYEKGLIRNAKAKLIKR